jgi:hypothetical protein
VKTKLDGQVFKTLTSFASAVGSSLQGTRVSSLVTQAIQVTGGELGKHGYGLICMGHTVMSINSTFHNLNSSAHMLNCEMFASFKLYLKHL